MYHRESPLPFFQNKVALLPGESFPHNPVLKPGQPPYDFPYVGKPSTCCHRFSMILFVFLNLSLITLFHHYFIYFSIFRTLKPSFGGLGGLALKHESRLLAGTLYVDFSYSILFSTKAFPASFQKRSNKNKNRKMFL